MTNDNDVIIEAVRLVKHFKSGSNIVPAVDDVSFKISRGKMVAIKGPSGCGKSTMMNLMGALDKPTTGSIVVDGINVSELRGGEEVKYRLKKVGFVFQSYNLIPNLTALENVMLPMDLLGGKRKEQEEKARKLLEKVGIDTTRQSRRPTKLSGGEQQRVAVARALANDPAIMLADEPTGNLDSKTGKRIVELLRDLAKEGKTIIAVTHGDDIASRADYVMEMMDGKLVKA